jgi:protein required for attachment to host cells
MQPTWIVLADEGRARILQWRKPGTDLEDIEELTDAGARADEADLNRDAAGRRTPPDAHGGRQGNTAMPGNATVSPGESKLEHEADLFARRVAQRLAEAHREHRFEHLRIAAAPRFLGRLRKALDTEVSRAVEDEIDKDLLQLDRRTLTQRFFPGEAAGP